jgi:hypothetical protein
MALIDLFQFDLSPFVTILRAGVADEANLTAFENVPPRDASCRVGREPRPACPDSPATGQADGEYGVLPLLTRTTAQRRMPPSPGPRPRRCKTSLHLGPGDYTLMFEVTSKSCDPAPRCRAWLAIPYPGRINRWFTARLVGGLPGKPLSMWRRTR